jgi:hypothetical protein
MGKFLPKQPGEILVLACDGHNGLHAANRLLKAHGLRLKWRGSYRELGDRVYLRVEKLPPA